MIYVRRASPLHAARAGVTALYGLALVALALSFTHPLILVAVAIAALGAAALCGVGGEVARAARFAASLALLVAVVNALVVREGLTVLVRFGEVPPFGQVDVTLEALVYGLLLGLRVFVIVVCFALLAATVDPDAVLRGMRRISFRSALTAALATRMVPVLTRDARRMDEARRCRPGGDAHSRGARIALVRAVSSGALDRAVDVAATLELRGYTTARRPPRGSASAVGASPWSRHDLSVGAAACALIALNVWALATGVASLDPYPRITASIGGPEIVLAAAIVVVALLPMAGRRGIEP